VSNDTKLNRFNNFIRIFYLLINNCE